MDGFAIARASSLTKSLCSFVSIFILSGCIAVNADSLDNKTTKTLTISSKGLTKLVVDAGAGFLKIEGDEQLEEIQVDAKIEAYGENYKLSLVSKGDYAKLAADANTKSNFNWGSESPKIDLTVRVPSKLQLDVKDGSGEILIKKMQKDIDIDDGSGSIVLSTIEGNININDGSGSMSLIDIKGNLNLDDGSGSTHISSISGNVVVDDGSGSLDLEKISGSLFVNDGSGIMEISNIGGLVTIDDGSGSIDVEHLQNGLKIIEQGSGGLHMSDVKGPVTMD